MRAGRAIEYMRQHQPPVKESTWFEDMDVNKDGTVSRDEYIANRKAFLKDHYDNDWTERNFSKRDVNNDGRLTKEELLAGSRK
jgi:Ca2+-binding EF-hand superfamily protein